jgi:hypothetical protein
MLAQISKPVAPFARADTYTRCPLYWFPLDMPAPGKVQESWYRVFLREFEKRIQERFHLAPATFLRVNRMPDSQRDHLIREQMNLVPVAGMAVVPGRPLPKVPTLEELLAEIRSGKMDLVAMMPEVCYWFLKGRDITVRLPLFGGGNVTQLFLEDPTAPVYPLTIPAAARKLLPEIDLDEAVQATVRLQHPFRKRSKELFGAPYHNELSYQGWSFILPALGTADFFQLPEADVRNLLALSPVYLNESRADRGVILASREPLEDLLKEIVQTMESQGVRIA